MAVARALIAAFLSARAATLLQQGALEPPTTSLADPKSVARLGGQTMWLIGMVAPFAGYLFQAVV